MSNYEEIPYPIYCFPDTALENIAAIAMLFGCSVAGLDNARVLELGCASGGNLIPMAARYSNASFVGVDRSTVQIDLACKEAQTLGLDNVKFITTSILDLKLDDQEFDFIIVHGVYSWVDSETQEEIHKILGKNLSETGIAYCSYNTLPGWNNIKSVRDMMIFHSKSFSDPREKILESRRMLNFVSENVVDDNSAYKKILLDEILSIEDKEDGYLFHEYLEAENTPCYFYEFIEKAKRNGLMYLGDSSLPSMYLENLKDNAASKLYEMNDTIRQEQYSDFLTNRRFRSTLLVRQGSEINRRLEPSVLDSIRFIPRLMAKTPIVENDNGDIEELNLVGVRTQDIGASATLSGKIACACYIQLLSSSPIPLSGDELIERVINNNSEMTEELIRNVWNEVVLSLILKGVVTITTGAPHISKIISKKPSVFAPARLRGLTTNLVPNLRHELIKLTDDERLVLQYVNGSSTVNEIVQDVSKHVENGELTLSQNGELVASGSGDVDRVLSDYVNSKLSHFAVNALLVS